MRQFLARPITVFRQIALCLLLGLPWSQVTRAAMPPVYDIEVIVFANKSSGDDGENWSSPDPDAIRPSGSFNEDNFTELATSYYTLNDISRSLERSGRYRVLFHRAWRQLAFDKAHAVAYPVHSIAENRRDSIEGIIKLIRERFLHLDVNLHLMSAAAGTEVMFSDSPSSKPAFELIETRRINSNVLHYFDHPRFGLIARVTPYISQRAVSSELQQDVETPSVNEAETEQPNPADDQLTR
jgi:hypothetical protein